MHDLPNSAALSFSVELLFKALHGVASAVYIKDRRHQWLFANAACCELFGCPPDQIINQPESAILSPIIAQQLAQQDDVLFGACSSSTSLVTLPNAEGTDCQFTRRAESVQEGAYLLCFLEKATHTFIPQPPVHTQSTPVNLVDDSAVACWDINQFRSLLANVPAATYQLVRQPNGEIEFPSIGTSIDQVLGLTCEQIQANPDSFLDQIHPLDRASLDKTLTDSAQTLDRWNWQGRYCHPNGSLIWIQTTAYPQLFTEDRVIWNGIVTDITSRHRVREASIERAVMEQALADNEARFRTIIETIPGAVFQLSVSNDTYQVDYISDRIQRVAGLSPMAIMGDIQYLMEYIHPLDRDRLIETIAKAASDVVPWQFEGRVIVPSEGTERWWSADAVPMENTQDSVVFCGVILETTQRKRAELRLQQSETQNKAIIKAIPDLMFRVNRDGIWLGYVSTNAAIDLLPNAYIPTGAHIAEYLPRWLAEKHLRMIEQALKTADVVIDEQQLTIGDRAQHEEVWVVPSGPNEVLFIIRDISDRKQTEATLRYLNEELERLSLTDSLTGIANRRRLDQYLQKEWPRAMRKQASIALILFDLDHFKDFNDTYGHQEGDSCLIKVAQAVQAIIQRSTDILARYGGEEFAVFLADTNIEQACQLADRIRETIQSLAIPHNPSEIHQTVTVSLGVSSMIPTLGKQPNLLIRQADEALYKAKQAGRNNYKTATYLP